MSVTEHEIFNHTFQTTNIWLKDLMGELKWEYRHKVYRALRASLQALRDRLTVAEAAHLGSQLPMLIRGLYYEGWDPTGKPQKVRHKEAFLTLIRHHFRDDPRVNAEQVARAVLKVLTQHVSEGEIADIKHCVPCHCVGRAAPV